MRITIRHSLILCLVFPFAPTASPAFVDDSNFEIVMVAPVVLKDDTLEIRPNIDLPVTIHIKNLKKTSTPEFVYFRFINEQNQSISGDFFVRRSESKIGTIQYVQTIKTPKRPGKYKLTIVPPPKNYQPLDAPDKEKYPSVNLLIK